jgi:hypothetical protein
MILWLVILGTALAGGLLVLHNFGRAKEVRERMLDRYRELLEEIERQTAEEEHASHKAPDEEA